MATLDDSCPGPWPAPVGEPSADLLVRAQAGDGPALDALIERYQERLLRIVRIRLGPQGTGLRRFLESSDVVQETWKAALGGLRELRLQGDAHLVNWLARIATNEIRDLLDRVQAQRRSLEREEPLGEVSGEQPTDPEAGPPAQAERQELREILDRTVAELSEDHREAILLRDYCGADWDSITTRLGRGNVHATQQLHQRAWIEVRRRARRHLGSAAQ